MKTTVIRECVLEFGDRKYGEIGKRLKNLFLDYYDFGNLWSKYACVTIDLEDECAFHTEEHVRVCDVDFVELREENDGVFLRMYDGDKEPVHIKCSRVKRLGLSISYNYSDEEDDVCQR